MGSRTYPIATEPFSLSAWNVGEGGGPVSGVSWPGYKQAAMNRENREYTPSGDVTNLKWGRKCV